MSKKLISLLLSVILILSCCSVAFIAFAEEAQTEGTAVAEQVQPTEKAEALQVSEKSEQALEDSALAVDEDASKLLKAYDALSNVKMTDEQKAKFEAAEKLIADFGTQFADALTSEEAAAQVDQILATVSDTVGKFLAAGGPVAELEAQIAAYSGNLNKKDPSEEDVKNYEALVAAYNKLTDAQKGEMDVVMFDKLFHLALDREYQLARTRYEKPVLKTCYAEGQAAAIALLGNAGYITAFDEAAELYTTVNNSKLSAQERLDAFAAASENARIYSNYYYPSYGVFYNKMDSSNTGKSFLTIAQAFQKELDKTDPFTEKAPATVSAPSLKDYGGDETNPEYIKAYDLYVEYTKEKAEYDARKENHTAAHVLAGMEKVGAAVPEYQALAKLYKDAIAAVAAFDESTANLAGAKAVVAAYGKLNSYQKKVADKLSVTLYAKAVKSGKTWRCAKTGAYTLISNCEDIANFDKLGAFVAVVNAIEEPYDNDDIVKVKDAYEEVPSSLRDQIPEEVTAKYKAILASIGPDRPSLDKPDLAVFKKTVVAYPDKVTHDQVATALPRIENLLVDTLLPMLGLEGGLTAMVNTGLYTNYTVTKLCQFLFPLLASLKNMDGFPSFAAGLVTVKPSDLAEKLNEPADAGKYAGIIEKLNKAEEEGQKAYNTYIEAGNEEDDLKKLEMYWTTQLNAADGDWGFKDGDKEGFMDAVSSVFRGISIITMLLTFENEINTTAGTYEYNAYEDLVPIFEALDLEGYMSSHEYTMYVKEAKKEGTNVAMSARIRPILVPIFNLVDKFAASPLDTLLDVLPKLGWALKSDLLNTQVSALIGKLGFGLGDSLKLDLTAGGIFDLVAPLLQDITVKDAVIDEKTGKETSPAVKISIKLDKEKFVKFVDDIGGCGTAVAKDSVARGTAYRLGVDSDKPDAFIVLVRWLYGEITTKENIASIKTVVAASDQDNNVKSIINFVIDKLAETPADDVIRILIGVIAPQMPELPKLPDIGGGSGSGDASSILGGIGDKLKDLLGGLFGGGDSEGGNGGNDGPAQTGDPSIPKTGGSVMTICFSLAATAALAGGAILLKKKNDDM